MVEKRGLSKLGSFMTQGTLEDAIALAVEHFRGMQDKDGQPFVLHLFRVMLSLPDADSQIVGVLHDIVEDTHVSLNDLKTLGYSETIVEAVRCLTHPEGVSYCEYIIGIRDNAIARECKLADLKDNYRLDRVAYRAGYPKEDAKRIQRYILSNQFLHGKIDETEYRQRMQVVE